MKTIKILDYSRKVLDMAERIESAYHEILQLKKLLEEDRELFDIIGWSGMHNKIRIKELHLKRLENRFEKLIKDYTN